MKHTISQAMLEKYQQLYEQEKKYRTQRAALRDQIIEMLRHGAVAEQGAIEAYLFEYSSVRLSKARVIEAVGQARYDQICAKVEPTINTQLRVRSKCHSHNGIKGKAMWMDEPEDDDWP